MALKYMLAKVPGELSSVKQICEVTGAPFDASARVMQIMTNHELLRSEQGTHGGYQIIKDLNKVSFYSLAEMILGPLAVIRCIKAQGPCELAHTCNIQSPLINLNNKVIEFYKQLSLMEILNSTTTKTDVFDSNQAALKEIAEPWL